MVYGIMVYGGLHLINTMFFPTEYKQLINLGYEKIKTLSLGKKTHAHKQELASQSDSFFHKRAVEEKLKSDQAKAMQMQQNIEAFQKDSLKKPQKNNPFDTTTPTQPSKVNKNNPFDNTMTRIEQQIKENSALEATINQCIATGNNYNELRSCLMGNIKDPKILDPLLLKIQKFEQENSVHSRNFNHTSNIRFALNDNDFRNHAKIVQESFKKGQK